MKLFLIAYICVFIGAVMGFFVGRLFDYKNIPCNHCKYMGHKDYDN